VRKNVSVTNIFPREEVNLNYGKRRKSKGEEEILDKTEKRFR
jgi:hypothetical protein